MISFNRIIAQWKSFQFLDAPAISVNNLLFPSSLSLVLCTLHDVKQFVGGFGRFREKILFDEQIERSKWNKSLYHNICNIWQKSLFQVILSS